ncbi:MAG: histidine kinase dimerization/phosphoacceptor domain -containing protein [Flavobacteriaceae bacterium]
MYKIAFLFSVLLISTLTFSQNNKVVDSLLNIVKTSKNDSVVMTTYNKLRRATYYSDAKASKNYTQKYLEYAQKRSDSAQIILAHFYLGNANVMSGNYEKALEKYLISANYYQQKKDFNRYASVLNSLGAVHEKTQNDSLSLHYYKLARKTGKSIKDFKRSGIASINISNIYNNKKDFKNALFFSEDSVEDLKTHPSYQSFLTLAEINLASVYNNTDDYVKASKLYDKLLKKIDSTKDMYSYAGILLGKGTALFRQGKTKKAKPFVEQAYQKFKNNNFTDEKFQMMPELISIYKDLGNYKKSVSLYDEYTILKDSILNNKQDKNIANAIQKYETDKKDAQLKVLSLENEKTAQQKQMYLYLALAGLLIAGLIGYSLRKNRKTTKILASNNIQLNKALGDNEILLKETHHRVKNSLQMISSLLYLQSENIEDEKAAASVKDGQIRVKSMALIHQKLYQKDNLTGVEVSDYINDLAESVFQSHNVSNEDINLSIDVDKMILDIDTITPIGIIINELIVNALKHAFDETSIKPKIIISLIKKQDALVLKVADNGKGFKPDTKKEKSFGMKLIKSLSRKLKADLTILSKNGTEVVLNIKRFEIK